MMLCSDCHHLGLHNGGGNFLLRSGFPGKEIPMEILNITINSFSDEGPCKAFSTTHSQFNELILDRGWFAILKAGQGN